MPSAPHNRRTASSAVALRRIAELARLRGWRHHHGTASPGALVGLYNPGFPTEVLVRGGTLLFLTMGDPRGQLANAERWWLEDLNAVSRIEAHIIDRRDLSRVVALLGEEPDHR